MYTYIYIYVYMYAYITIMKLPLKAEGLGADDVLGLVAWLLVRIPKFIRGKQEAQTQA